MLTYFSEHQSAHAPARELNNGEWMDYAESPGRVVSMLTAIDEVRAPDDHGLEPLLAVHDQAYLAFLESAHADWLAAGRSGDAIGYTFPHVRRRSLTLERIDARLGAFGFDAATPIAQGTWKAAYWGAQSALSGLSSIADREVEKAFALCRPPGHHAGRDYYGGYCYLNNAAIAARQAQKLGLGPVAILDVDYHHGNGTQDIFYRDRDVLFASIHADPSTDYPYFWGHSDESGEGDGAGATFNQPLPRGTDWPRYQKALMSALEKIDRFGARFLVISFGADTFEDDPISHFALRTDDMARIGKAIASLGLPTLSVMEGGYDIAALGDNVGAFVAGLESGSG